MEKEGTIHLHTREIVNKRSHTKPRRCASVREEQCNPTSGQTLARARTERFRADALCRNCLFIFSRFDWWPITKTILHRVLFLASK